MGGERELKEGEPEAGVLGLLVRRTFTPSRRPRLTRSPGASPTPSDVSPCSTSWTTDDHRLPVPVRHSRSGTRVPSWASNRGRSISRSVYRVCSMTRGPCLSFIRSGSDSVLLGPDSENFGTFLKGSGCFGHLLYSVHPSYSSPVLYLLKSRSSLFVSLRLHSSLHPKTPPHSHLYPSPSLPLPVPKTVSEYARDLRGPGFRGRGTMAKEGRD